MCDAPAKIHIMLFWPSQQPHGCYSQWIHVCHRQEIHVKPQPTNICYALSTCYAPTNKCTGTNYAPANNYMDTTGNAVCHNQRNPCYSSANKTWYTTANNYMNATAKRNTCIANKCYATASHHMYQWNTCYALANGYMIYHSQQLHVMPPPTTTWLLQSKEPTSTCYATANYYSKNSCMPLPTSTCYATTSKHMDVTAKITTCIQQSTNTC